MSDPRLQPENHREDCQYRQDAREAAQSVDPIPVRCTCGLLRTAPPSEKPVDPDGSGTTMR